MVVKCNGEIDSTMKLKVSSQITAEHHKQIQKKTLHTNYFHHKKPAEDCQV